MHAPLIGLLIEESKCALINELDVFVIHFTSIFSFFDTDVGRDVYRS